MILFQKDAVIENGIDLPRPKRIVSLVPSQTELLHALGLDEEVVGITKFCIHPNEWFRSKFRIGGTKAITIEKVRSLEPDLIIANKEENTKEDVQALAEIATVYVSDIKDLSDALQMIREVGLLVHRKTSAEALAQEIEERYVALNSKMENTARQSALYLIWKVPYMAAAQETFIDAMFQYTPYKNALAQKAVRYPVLSEDDIRVLAPDIILLSSEPFPFKGKHTQEIKERFPYIPVLEVDGESFSWYGSRLLNSAAYFEQMHEQLGSTP